MKKRIINVMLSIWIVTGCTGFVIENNFYGNFYLIAADIGDELSLSYHTSADQSNYGTVIPATVFAVGYDKRYIIVKQHPRQFPNSPDKSVTNYYIVPIRSEFDWKTKNDLLGPMTLAQFKNKSSDLHLEHLKFTIVYEDLE